MMAEEILPTDLDEGPSKSERKREMHERQALGERLTRLGPAQLERIPLSEPLRQAIADYQRFKAREAKRRQLQFIGRLMREVDREAIEQAWERTQAGSEAAKKIQHKLERWRDRLLAEGDEALNELVTEFPGVDRQPIRHLVREARREAELAKPPAASRKLFQYLRQQLVDAV